MAPSSQPRERPYHHGNLRRGLLDAAIEVIGETGPAAMSMREVARRAGVSSAAPTHHFGDKSGLLTALAAEGFELLAAAMADEYERSHSFREVGVAYVRFAVTNSAHFDVMFRPELLRLDDDALLASRHAASA
jgi:AcrR family transcriptional regulator